MHCGGVCSGIISPCAPLFPRAAPRRAHPRRHSGGGGDGSAAMLVVLVYAWGGALNGRGDECPCAPASFDDFVTDSATWPKVAGASVRGCRAVSATVSEESFLAAFFCRNWSILEPGCTPIVRTALVHRLELYET